MIGLFLKERISWILFFSGLQILVLGMGYLDSGIAFRSTVYMVFLSILFSSLFLVVRYVKETRFYRTMKNVEPTVDTAVLPDAESPFETIAVACMTEQTRWYKNQLDALHTQYDQEQDDMLNWIHEVKTPLTTMQLLIERTEPAIRAKLMYEWLRVHLLLDQQLHQKRIPFIRNDLYIEKVHIEKLLFHEIKSLRQWCIQKGIGFNVSLEKDEVLTDAKWLGFMIRQLLTNAVKYSEASDILIRSMVDDGVTILSIEDCGRGIVPKDLSRIFDKGFTGTVDHQDHAATGMGLYLTKQVADSLYISIHVESEYGEGTTFTLTFPKENELTHIAGAGSM